jgi:hypothetical protein
MAAGATSRIIFHAGVVITTVCGGLWAAQPASAISGGQAVADGEQAFVAKIVLGDNVKACTAALVHPQWIVATKACFALDSSPVVSGPLPQPTTVTVGRANLDGTAGHDTTLTKLVAHPDRDVVLAKLATKITDITPVPVASTAPVTGETLRLSGYGRTTDEWVPSRLRTATFTVNTVSPDAVQVSGSTSDVSTCMGDAGGSAVRETSSGVQLVALHAASWQRGCYGVTETRSGATEVRVDGLAAWIGTETTRLPVETGSTQETNSRYRWADIDGDRRSDYVIIDDSGPVRVFLNRGGDGGGGWVDWGTIATGVTKDHTRVRFADFDGDFRDDYVVIEDSGVVRVWLNRGGDGRGGWLDQGIVATGVTKDHTSVRFADFDGDFRDDYLVIEDSGVVRVWLNRGGDGRGGWQDGGVAATGLTTDRNRVRIIDFDGDHKSDYVWIQGGGAVQVFLNKGGDRAGGWSDLGRIATGVTSDANLVRFADFDGDDKADYLARNESGAVSYFANRGGDGRGGWLAGRYVVNP